jgi:phage host-nuclease inhibitor protein Gam
MARSLYEIDKEIMALFDPETGEISDLDRLDAIIMEREAKIENVVLWQKNEKAYIAALKAEKKSIEERIKQAEKNAERREEWLKKTTNGEPFTTPKCTLTFRTTSSVEVVDLALIPEEFIRTTITANKEELLKRMRYGEKIPGVSLAYSKSMIIK